VRPPFTGEERITETRPPLELVGRPHCPLPASLLWEQVVPFLARHLGTGG
jgi:hypothetical protein